MPPHSIAGQLELPLPPVQPTATPVNPPPAGTFYEFFAGAGMVRAGLGRNWASLFVNDFSRQKANSYRCNWHREPVCQDIRDVTPEQLPGASDMAWASFPCQDLSLAGRGDGLDGDRSGTFWPFWNLMLNLKEQDRAPTMVVLENVCGALTSHDGQDFISICDAMYAGGYRFGAVVVDAAVFLPQSRPRLFVIGVCREAQVPRMLAGAGQRSIFHTGSLVKAFRRLPERLRQEWIWWKLPVPPVRSTQLADLIEEAPTSVSWHHPDETAKLLNLMNERHRAKVKAMQRLDRRVVGTVYRRTRTDSNGDKALRAEVRFDGVAGCLRTPTGGSSRQLVLEVEGERTRSRLMSSRETARLMGLPDSYVLPDNYNEAYHLTGDGVAVPVVRFLAKEILEPVLALNQSG